ncbi:MAG: proton-conducting transporter membrane subunit [Anaerolineae bacterium]
MLAQYALLIPLFPLLAFFIIVVLGANRNKRLSSNIAIGALVLSGILSYLIFIQAIGVGPDRVLEAAVNGEAPWAMLWNWTPIGTSTFQVGTYLDPVAILMLVMVTTVGLMIFIYAQGYMGIQDPAHTDPKYARFFAFLSLFACGMLGFVISPNLVQSLVFWEIMGLCSFLLIGFWFDNPKPTFRKGKWTTVGVENSNAAKKAFLTTRVGDVGLFLGIILLSMLAGTTQWNVLYHQEAINRLQEITVFGIPALVVVCLLIFMGAVGKSAQFPLHVWLPDAMAGPTPVSAMIHAATMVAAGVFLIARTYPLFAAAGGEGHSSVPLLVVAVIGAFTAIFAATIGFAQGDIKRILAFSTISQLGLMFMALGTGAWVAGVFHMLTHAFFKALLFLGSGSVIHGMEHGLHHGHGESHATTGAAHHEAEMEDAEDEAPRAEPGLKSWEAEADDPQSVYNMGGLRHRMPVTFWTYMMGVLALTGIPIWAGFWSKDEILAHAYETGQYGFWLAGGLATLMTAFYMARQVFLVFFGQPRTDAATHASESVRSMTIPLIVLAVFSTFVGLVGVPDVVGPLAFGGWLHHWLALVPTTGLGPEAVAEAVAPTSLNALVAGAALTSALIGWALGYLLYGRKPMAVGGRDPLSRIPGVWPLLWNKYWIDELYSHTFIAASLWLSRIFNIFDQQVIDRVVNFFGRLTRVFARAFRWFDTHIVDGVVNYLGLGTREVGQWMRLLQTGIVQNYLLVVFVAIVLIAFLLRR